SAAITPGDGRKPTTPQKAAGLRSDPPVSDPEAIGTIPQARAAAEPPEEPAAEHVVSNGLPVAPNTGFRVFAPAAHSGTFVLPMTIAPACRRSATKPSSAAGTLSFMTGLPKVVSRPLVLAVSLIPTGRPCSGPSAAPFITACSLACAVSRARSK